MTRRRTHTWIFLLWSIWINLQTCLFIYFWDFGGRKSHLLRSLDVPHGVSLDWHTDTYLIARWRCGKLLFQELYGQGDQPEKVKKSVTYPKAGGPGGCLGPLVGSRSAAPVGVQGAKPPGKFWDFHHMLSWLETFQTTFDWQRLFLMLFIALSRLQWSLLVED